MRLHGWCEKCRKFKPVRTKGWTANQTPVGICSSCEEKEEQRRQQR